MIKGEVLLVVNGGVEDSIVYDTVSKKIEAIRQFLQVRYTILKEQPYADVQIQTREVMQ